MKKYLALAALLLPLTSAHAEVDFVLGMGLSLGGEKLAETTGKEAVRTGQMLNFFTGIELKSEAIPFELATHIGYKTDSAEGTNAKGNFRHYPAELLLFYRNGSHRFGGGGAYHFDTRFKVKTIATGIREEIRYDDEMGIVVQYDYIASNNASIGFRFELIDFMPKSYCVEGDCVDFALIDPDYDKVRSNSFSVTVTGRY